MHQQSAARSAPASPRRRRCPATWRTPHQQLPAAHRAHWGRRVVHQPPQCLPSGCRWRARTNRAARRYLLGTSPDCADHFGRAAPAWSQAPAPSTKWDLHRDCACMQPPLHIRPTQSTRGHTWRWSGWHFASCGQCRYFRRRVHQPDARCDRHAQQSTGRG